MRKVIGIEGMHCASCAGNVEKSLKKLVGVREASASVMTKKAFVELEREIPDDELKKAVAKAGYKAVSVEQR